MCLSPLPFHNHTCIDSILVILGFTDKNMWIVIVLVVLPKSLWLICYQRIRQVLFFGTVSLSCSFGRSRRV